MAWLKSLRYLDHAAPNPRQLLRWAPSWVRIAQTGSGTTEQNEAICEPGRGPKNVKLSEDLGGQSNSVFSNMFASYRGNLFLIINKVFPLSILIPLIFISNFFCTLCFIISTSFPMSLNQLPSASGSLCWRK